MSKLPQRDKKSWYRIENKASGPVAAYIYDEIGLAGITADAFLSDLSQISGDVELHLSSPGGEVFDGIAIYNAIKNRGNVNVVVDSLAASIASIIAMGGKTVTMTKNAQLMIHDGFGMTSGNAKEMRKMADVLDKTSDNLASIYAERTGTDAKTWRKAMKKETWYSADEAVSAGLADRVEGDGVPVKNIWNLADLGFKGPQKPKKVKCCKHCSKLMDSVDSSEWDASKAWAAGAKSDDPAAFYNAICAGKKSGDPSLQSSHALPYKYSPSSAPNAAAVRNALARLNQTQGLTNKSEAQALLERLMKQVNPDYEAQGNESEDDWNFDPDELRTALRAAFENRN